MNLKQIIYDKKNKTVLPQKLLQKVKKPKKTEKQKTKKGTKINQEEKEKRNDMPQDSIKEKYFFHFFD